MTVRLLLLGLCLALPANADAGFFENIADKLEHAVAAVRPLLERYGYGVVFAAVAVEGFGIPAPGQTLLIAAAIDAAQGGLNLVVLLVLAALAAIIGNSIGYLIGRLGGRALLYRFRVNEQRLQRMEGFFERYGGWVIVLGRFFDGLRQLNGIVAGTLEMPWWRFTAFNVLGAVLWTTLWGLGSYFLDKDIHPILAFVKSIEPWIAVLSLAGAGWLVIYLLRRRRTG